MTTDNNQKRSSKTQALGKDKKLHRYLNEYLVDINTMLRALDRDFTTLQRRLIAWAQDGYPTNTGTIGAKGGFSDPTALAVTNPDQVRLDRERLQEMIISIHAELSKVEAIRTLYMDNTSHVTRHNHALTKCANQHGCPDDAWAAKAGRCTTCYEYNRTNQRDRRKSTHG